LLTPSSGLMIQNLSSRSMPRSPNPITRPAGSGDRSILG
jgi:hypothetical protein